MVELCREAGILCYEVESPPASLDALRNATYDEMLIGAIKSVGAQQEIRKIQQRHQIGMHHRIAQGQLPNVPPYGYRLQYDIAGNSEVVLDPAAAAAVRRIFDLYLEGMGVVAIAGILNGEHIPAPREATWGKGGLLSILSRVWTYAGFAEYNRRSRKRAYFRAKGQWPAIITEDEAKLIEAERERRGQSRRLVNTPYLLSGVVWCVDCQRAMNINIDNNRGRLQLRCQYRPHRGGWIDAKSVMAALQATIEYLNTVSIDEIAVDTQAAATDDLDKQESGLNAERKQIEASLSRADQAFTDGLMDIDRYRQQTQRLTARRDAVDVALRQLAEKRDAARYAGERKQRLEEVRDAAEAMINHPNQTLGNAWLRRFLRVWVSGNKVVRVEIF